jgi:DNA-directed RNA polymerase subunit RPC12/RpoP
MSQYHLPCPNCQAKLPVSKSQAGMIVNCPSCGSNVPVPTIRGFSKLELAEPDNKSRTSHTKAANTFVRILAVLLLLVSVPTLAYGGYLYSIRASVSDPLDLTEEDLIEDVRKSMLVLPPSGIWDVWNDVAIDGITELPIPDYFRFKRMVEAQRPIMQTCFAVGGCCLAGFVATLFLSRKPK